MRREAGKNKFGKKKRGSSSPPESNSPRRSSGTSSNKNTAFSNDQIRVLKQNMNANPSELGQLAQSNRDRNELVSLSTYRVHRQAPTVKQLLGSDDIPFQKLFDVLRLEFAHNWDDAIEFAKLERSAHDTKTLSELAIGGQKPSFDQLIASDGLSADEIKALVSERLVSSWDAVIQRAAQKSLPLRPHPLSQDTNEITITLPHMQQGIMIEHLLLESTEEARKAMQVYRYNRAHADADVMLFKSILATSVLHKSGMLYGRINGSVQEKQLNDTERRLLALALEPYDENTSRELLATYGLDQLEHRAIQAYSEANKTVKENPFYMGQDRRWGKYGNGWVALASAMTKLPSLARLGLEVTMYRASRVKAEAESILKLEPETYILHGAETMGEGQRHYMSTALTYNTHWVRAMENGGVIAITGTSGVLINPFGIQGFLDGAEILYPPGIVTKYEGYKPDAYTEGGRSVPVLHLREVSQIETGQRLVEDKEYKTIAERNPTLTQAKLDLIQRIDFYAGLYGNTYIAAAREKTRIDGPLMYLTYNELRALHQELDQLMK